MVQGRPQYWGARSEEIDGVWPGDTLGAQDASLWFRAIDVAASPAVVFRWLCQLRAAPYSYDWLDNLGRRSPRTLTPGLEKLEAGQRFMGMFRLVHYTQDESITLEAGTPLGALVVTYRATQSGSGSRLAVKIRAPRPGNPFTRLLAWAFAWGDLIMMRKQLSTLKALAERDAVNASRST